MLPRLHASTWLALVPVVAVLVLANVPGEYTVFDPEHLFDDNTVCDHGWPCTWLVRNGLHDDEDLWTITADVCRFDGLALAANLLVGLTILAPLAAAVEWRRRRRLRIWQFTLADLLLVTLIAGGITAWYATQRREFARVAFVARQGEVGWEAEPAFPEWLREAIGDERLSKLGIMRPAIIEFDLPGVDPARDADMAAIRAIVDYYPEQLRLVVPRYQAAKATERRPFLGGDYLRSLPRLRNLVLERMDDEVLSCLDGCRDLRTLIIKDDKAKLSPAGAAWLGGLRHLRQLRASRRCLGDAGTAALGSLSRLEVLVLDGAGDTDVGHFAGLRNLRVLELDHATITDTGLALLAGFRRLERLSIHSTRMTGAGFKMLGRLQRLHTLDLGYSGIDDDGLVALGGLRSLVFLNLEFTPLTGRGLQQLAGLRQLRSLRLNTTEIDDHGLSTFPALQRLESVDLSNTHATEMGLSSLNSLGHLRELDLSSTRVASLESLDVAGLSHLEKVDLRRSWVQDAELHRIKEALPKLAVIGHSEKIDLDHFARQFSCDPDETGTWVPIDLDLSGPNFGDAQLREIVESKCIRKVTADSSRITDAGLALLAGFQNLEEIDLTGTLIGDAGLAHLCELPRLATLNIANTKVTCQGLKQLAPFPALQEIGLDPSQIDAATVAMLKLMPRLEAVEITRVRPPWGSQYRGAADFKEFIKLLRRDLPAVSFTTSNKFPHGSEWTSQTRGCF